MFEGRERCTTLCDFPCAKDHRTRAEKIAAYAKGGDGGERENAKAMLAKQPAKQPPKAAPKPNPGAAGPLTGETLEEVLRRFRGGFSTSANDYRLWAEGTFDAQRFGENNRTYKSYYQPGDRDPLEHEQETLDHWCKMMGKHEWVVIGSTMYHTDIKRCTVCGEYDPPRRKEAKSGAR